MYDDSDINKDALTNIRNSAQIQLVRKVCKIYWKISLSMQNFIATQFKIMAKVEKAIFFRIIGLKSMTISVPESSRAAIKESELQNWCSLFLT